MSITQYIKDRRLLLWFQGLGLLALFLYLQALGSSSWQCAFVVFLWCIGLLLYLILDYGYRARYQKKMRRLTEELEDCYLITEILKKPEDAQGQFYYEILKYCNRAMANRVQTTKAGQREYREYIEALVHEVKNPIAAMEMMVKNHPSAITDAMTDELARMNYYIEQALFYAKIETLSQDYLVRAVSLRTLVQRVLRNNARTLILNQVSVESEDLDFTVYSDEKWLEFVLNQLVVNAAKYVRKDARRLCIHAEAYEEGIRLDFWDNGLGIPDEELPHVFEKGFVGTTGRKIEKSTGLGLYIAKNLCLGLGHSITLASAQNEFTLVTVWFPKQALLDEKGL